MNRDYAARHAGDSVLDARVRSYELAGRMQASVPEATEITGESAATRALYGMDSPVTEAFGKNCLRARRLLERGVRFVQLYHGGAFGSPRINWDAHEDLADNHRTQAASFDHQRQAADAAGADVGRPHLVCADRGPERSTL